MNLTAYHSRLLTEDLTRRHASDDLEKLMYALVDAQVDLNPHQVEAALFAFKSPLSKGAILADEVGLGKTIEAGLVISQRWAERKRRILVITPANLRKQWFQELSEKFFLPCSILESKSYNNAIRTGNYRPFETSSVVIISYQFACSKVAEVQAIPWDMVVMDEAHRLRNVYKPPNVIARTLKGALDGVPKILLTATPLQNSLLELYGLVSIVDDRIFGDVKSFREQFTNLANTRAFEALKARLKPVCHRTLRRQVMPYVRYTKRFPIVEEFTPHDDENALYDLVSKYLQRENLIALPNSQRSLLTLVLRKLLASSTFAIAGALESMKKRLKKRLEKAGSSNEPDLFEGELEDDYEALDETAEEWQMDDETEALNNADRAAMEREVRDLDRFHALASGIEQNAKGRALLQALEVAFAKADEFGAVRKAIIFTESKRTQAYLLRLLEGTPYQGGIVLFNGSNSDPASRKLLEDWLERHKGTDRVTGSRTADMRSALVDEFRERAQIMIATEAGAEGINLQFCSLVVNYDLPWNPQRIEQRIGRCHRYGQQHDVVVVNFLNRKNEADQRVFELLNDKFQLFEGVFGASDEVLGAIESGVDFEKRVSDIYQRCRKPEEIQLAFDELQRELSLEINEAMTRTRQQLLENFDEEVNEKLRLNKERSEESLGRFERMLMQLTRFELGDAAEFHASPSGEVSSFTLKRNPFAERLADIPLGLYELPRRSGEAHFYRLGHDLAQGVLDQVRSRTLSLAEVEFDYSGHNAKISVLEQLRGQAGWLRFSAFTVEALDQVEDHLILVATTDDGRTLEADAARRLFNLDARVIRDLEATDPPADLERITSDHRDILHRGINRRNAQYFEQEAERLDAWADDLKVGLEREIKELDREIKEARRAATAAVTLEEKLEGQKQVRNLEAERSKKRRALFDAQDEIDQRREKMIQELEAKLKQGATLKTVFTLRWRLA